MSRIYFALASGIVLLFIFLGQGSTAQEQEEPERELSCHPRVLYRGDTLTVDLPMAHDGSEFAIPRGIFGALPMMISFEPLPKDKIAPLISPAVFAKMKQIRLVTTRAKGSPGTWRWQAPDGPTALKPPEPIFTKATAYQALLGYGLGAEDGSEHILGSCPLLYFDRRRPKAGEEVPKDAIFIPRNPGPHHNPKLHLTCTPATVYRGQTVILGLPKFHRNYQLAILDPNWNIKVLSFVRGPYDKYGPAVPASRFARMRQMKLSTSSARGTDYGPIADSPPQPIFTRSGGYLAMIGTNFIKHDNGPFGACWFHYINEPRPKDNR